MSMNRVNLNGRLTKDPELRYTPNGVAVCNFTLAVKRNYKNAQGEYETDFIPIVVYRGLAELCANSLSKGKLAGVDGRIQVRSYNGQDGQKRWVTEVIAEEVDFLSPRDDYQTQGQGNQGYASQGNGNQAQNRGQQNQGNGNQAQSRGQQNQGNGNQGQNRGQQNQGATHQGQINGHQNQGSGTQPANQASGYPDFPDSGFDQGGYNPFNEGFPPLDDDIPL